MFQKHSAYIFTVGVKSLPYDLFNGLMALKTEFYSLTFTYSYFEVLTSNQYDVLYTVHYIVQHLILSIMVHAWRRHAFIFKNHRDR